MLFLHKWSLDYNPDHHLLTVMPMWLRMPHFPIGLWNRRNIITVASLVGVPLEIDGSTLSQGKIIFARVRVAVDLSKPLLKGTFVGHKGSSTWQPFIYENIPIFCTSCGSVGHKAEHCKASSSTLGADIGKVAVGLPVLEPKEPASKPSGNPLPPIHRPKATEGGAKATPRIPAAVSQDSGVVLQAPAASGLTASAQVDSGADLQGWTHIPRKPRRASKVGPSTVSINRPVDLEFTAHEDRELRFDGPTLSDIPDSVKLIADNIAKSMASVHTDVAQKPLKSILKRNGGTGPGSSAPL